MAKEILKDVVIRNTKPADKDQRLNDGGACIYSLNPMALNGGGLIRFFRQTENIIIGCLS